VQKLVYRSISKHLNQHGHGTALRTYPTYPKVSERNMFGAEEACPFAPKPDFFMAEKLSGFHEAGRCRAAEAPSRTDDQPGRVCPEKFTSRR
jgi:hypothetical protein